MRGTGCLARVSVKPAAGPVQLPRITGPALTLRPKDPAAAPKRTDTPKRSESSTDSYVCTPFAGWACLSIDASHGFPELDKPELKAQMGLLTIVIGQAGVENA